MIPRCHRPAGLGTWLRLTALVLACAPALWADWNKEDIHKYDFEIEVRTQRLLRQNLDPHKFAEDIGLKPPVFPPALSPDQVAEILRLEIERAVDAEFPRSRLQAVKEEAEVKYAMVKPGQEVTVQMRMRRSEYSYVTKRYYERKLDKIRLGDNWFSLADVHPDELPRFDLAAHEDAIRRHIRRETNKFEEGRKLFLEKQQDGIANRVWRDYGYVKVASSGAWIPREKYFSDKYQQRWDELHAQLSQEVAAAVYTEAGLVKNAGSGLWEPTGLAAAPKPVAPPRESILERAKRMIQEARKKNKVEVVPEIDPAAPAGTPATTPTPPTEPAKKPAGGLFED